MPNTITDTITELADNKSDIQDALVAKGVTSAGKHGFNKFATDITSITNQYTSSDEGKVVQSGSLVAQTSTTVSQNGTVNTTANNQVVVDVPNSYTQSDEGKVVSNGALVAQTAMSTEITANDTYDTTLYNSVTVNVPQGGGTSTGKKDVNFYDYDGTVVASYTASEFAELTALPDNPTHEGLTAQGWNWTLSDAKTYVASYGKLNIGQMYITSDGKTRLYIELTEGRLSPYLKLYLNANSELDIDWGDGSAHSTFTNTGSSPAFSSEMHTYTSAGSYVIAITVVSGRFSLSSSSSSMSTLLTNNNSSASSPDVGYLNSIKRVEIGSGITSIGSYAFNTCTSLTFITIPSSVTSIGSYAFRSCYSLTSITIPSGITSIGANALQYCYSLVTVTINKAEGSISGSPWGASTSSPTSTQIVWAAKKAERSIS